MNIEFCFLLCIHLYRVKVFEKIRVSHIVCMVDVGTLAQEGPHCCHVPMGRSQVKASASTLILQVQ